MQQLEKNSVLIVIILALFMALWGIGATPLLDPDEPVFAEAARGMLASGDFLTPRLFGNPWYDKPPLFYWLVASAQALFGDNEFAARFPSAVMACAVALMLYVSGTKLFNERAGFWSAVVLATCVQFFCMGKAAVTDMTLLFFMSAALLSFLHGRYWLMYICMAFAALTSGPLGIIFPLAIIFIYLLLMGRLGKLFSLHLIRGLLLCCLLAAPWYYAMYTMHGSEFVDAFFSLQNLIGSTATEHAHETRFWYYLPVVLLGLFPWTGLLLQSLVASISESRIDDMRKLLFLHVWWAFVLVFFTVYQTRVFSYILPMFPPLALTIGWNISRMLVKLRHNTTFTGWLWGSGLLFLLVSLGWLYAGEYFGEVRLSLILLGAFSMLLGCVSLYALKTYRDIELAAGLHALLGAVTMFAVFTFILPAVADRFSVRSISAEYSAASSPAVPVYVDKPLRPGFTYYAKTQGVELLPRAGALEGVLRRQEHKYILVRGYEYRQIRNAGELLANVETLKEIGDIYLLEQK